MNFNFYLLALLVLISGCSKDIQLPESKIKCLQNYVESDACYYRTCRRLKRQDCWNIKKQRKLLKGDDLIETAKRHCFK